MFVQQRSPPAGRVPPGRRHRVRNLDNCRPGRSPVCSFPWLQPDNREADKAVRRRSFGPAMSDEAAFPKGLKSKLVGREWRIMAYPTDFVERWTEVDPVCETAG